VWKRPSYASIPIETNINASPYSIAHMPAVWIV
jgi:hypothetical protein